MFVVHQGPRGRVVLHRQECPLLDERYDYGGWRHIQPSFATAVDMADELIRLLGARHHVCGWCRPNAPH